MLIFYQVYTGSILYWNIMETLAPKLQDAQDDDLHGSENTHTQEPQDVEVTWDYVLIKD